ncbi:MAG TPA: hypothetical protein VKM93_25890 [Terriglobia bacterium]|nr:hypothetical protein [Terriglobia bacterium]
MENPSQYPLSSYIEMASAPAVFRPRAEPQFRPLDVNLAFLARSGWNQSVDRLRFHFQHGFTGLPEHPVTQVMGSKGSADLLSKVRGTFLAFILA